MTVASSGGVRQRCRLALAALLTMYSATLFASSSAEALQWLTRIQQSAQKLNYTGTVVYLQQGGQPQTSRITHVQDGTGEHERVEWLDGAPVVVVRHNDDVRSYVPDTKTILIEKRRNKSSFPALLGAQLAGIAEQYNVRIWDQQRVAGLDCQVPLLESKDGLRYAHKLWADINSGLLLKAQVFNEKGDVVEQTVFTQVEIGGGAEHYQPLLAKHDGGRDWHVASQQVTEANFAEAGWTIDMPLPGFRKLLELKSSMGQGGSEVGQIVYSDGLAAVSVFLEPIKDGANAAEGLSSKGAINMFRRKVGGNVVTVLGEAPAACVTRIGKAVQFKAITR